MSTKPTKKGQELESLREQIIKLQKQLDSYKCSNDYFLKHKLFLHYDIKEPEKVVVDCETQLPVLKEIDKKKIQKGKEADPIHLIIQGDNYHALSVLSYTHAGKIDLIYIDPPYNTGNKDFIYNDCFVDREDSFRHSKWLSFMAHRLRLAKDLLAETGVIFISIDDNEQAHLRLLCDQIFGEENFVTMFIWEKTQHFGRQKINYYNNGEYVLCYAKKLYDGKLKELLVEYIKTEFEDAPLFNASNPLNILTFPAGSTKFNMPDGIYEKSDDKKYELLDKVIVKNGKNKNEFRLKFHSRWSAKTVIKEYEKGTTYWVKTTNFAIRAIYANGKKSNESPKQIIFTNRNNEFVAQSRFGIKVGTSEDGSNELKEIIGEQGIFDYPKPETLIEYLLSLYENKSATILDFFAGSGTTGHAVLKLNAQDGGTRQFILCTNNENGIAENVTYPRIKNVIDGYGDTAGIPANLRYFQTDFVEKKGSASQQKIDLTRQCAEMLSVKENVFEVVKIKKSANNYKFFKNGDKYLGIFFDFFTDPEFADFIAELHKLPPEAEKAVYIFVLDGSASILADEFAGVANCEVKEIPQKILDIYKQLVRKVAKK